jgi:type I restriction enzyme S subunit
VRIKKGYATPEYINNVIITQSFQNHLLMLARAGGATREAITKQQLEELLIPLPPIHLQTKFSSIYSKIEKQKALVRKTINETQTLFDSLMSQYFD